MFCLAITLMIIKRIPLNNSPYAAAFKYFLIVEPVLLLNSQSISPEVYIVFLMISVVYLTTSKTFIERSEIACAILFGTLLGLLFITKPAFILLYPFIFVYIYLNKRLNSLIVSYILPIIISVVIATVCIWYNSANTGKAVLSDRTPLHIYNRIVYADKSLSIKGPATNILLTNFNNDKNKLFRPHWDILPVLKENGYSFDYSAGLMRKVAIEALKEHPGKFLTNSMIYPLHYWVESPLLSHNVMIISDKWVDMISKNRPIYGAVKLSYLTAEEIRNGIKYISQHILPLILNPFILAFALLSLVQSLKIKDYNSLYIFFMTFILHVMHTDGEKFVNRYLIILYPIVWVMFYYAINNFLVLTKEFSLRNLRV